MADAKRKGASKAASRGGGKATTRSGGSKATARSGDRKATTRSGGSKATARSGGSKARASSRGSREGGSREGASSARNGRSSRARGMSAIEAAQAARRHLAELLGRPVEGVLGVERDHANWVVTAQVVELERIPNTMDVLGDYEAVLDKDGEVVVCHRTRRYRRSQVDEDQ